MFLTVHLFYSENYKYAIDNDKVTLCHVHLNGAITT